MGSGHHAAAVAHYDRVGRYHPWEGVRVEANLRAATVAAVDLADPWSSSELLRRVLESGADPLTKAGAFERLGQLAWNALNEPRDAAVAFQTAYDLAPGVPEAERRLVQAARARTESGDVDAALRAWELVARRLPGQRALARVSQASLLLAEGDTDAALTAYEQALVLARDATVQQVARLGAATCKERMGEIEAAMADIDAADLPERVSLERQRRLEDRAGAL